MRIKRVEIKVMSANNKKVIRTFRLTPPDALVKSNYVKTSFTSEGAEQVLGQAIDEIDAENPGHKWRLVNLGRYRYKLVWDDTIEVGNDAG